MYIRACLVGDAGAGLVVDFAGIWRMMFRHFSTKILPHADGHADFDGRQPDVASGFDLAAVRTSGVDMWIARTLPERNASRGQAHDADIQLAIALDGGRAILTAPWWRYVCI